MSAWKILTPSESAISWASLSTLTSNARMTANLSFNNKRSDSLLFNCGNDDQKKKKKKKKKTSWKWFNQYRIHSSATYWALCSNMVDAFMTSFLTTGPMRIFAYCQKRNEFESSIVNFTIQFHLCGLISIMRINTDYLFNIWKQIQRATIVVIDYLFSYQWLSQ